MSNNKLKWTEYINTSYIDKIIAKADKELEITLWHLTTDEDVNLIVERYSEEYYEIDEFKNIKSLDEYKEFMRDSINLFIDYALSRENKYLNDLRSDEVNDLINKIYIKFADILDAKKK